MIQYTLIIRSSCSWCLKWQIAACHMTEFGAKDKEDGNFILLGV